MLSQFHFANNLQNTVTFKALLKHQRISQLSVMLVEISLASLVTHLPKARFSLPDFKHILR